METDRRRFPRQSVSLSALVHPQQGRSWLCTIRDFCQGGMMLVGSGSRSLKATGADIKPGDAIDLHFSVPTPNGQKHYRMNTLVARILDNGNGMGVRFGESVSKDSFEALMEFAIASGTVSPVSKDGVQELDDPEQLEEGQIPESLLRDQNIEEVDASKIKGRLKKLMGRTAARILDSFLETCNTELLVHARDAGTNAVQMMYFEGLDQLEKRGEELRSRFADGVLDPIENISDLESVLEKRRRQNTGNTTKLELVDTEEFEEWLAVAEIISKAENRFSDVLFDIRTQLGMVAKPWSHKDVVPVGPSVIAWAFDDAISCLDVRRQVQNEMFELFGKVLMPNLEHLYTALATQLEESGVFPSLEDIKETLRRSTVRKLPVRQAPVTDYQEMEPAVREAAMAADGIPTTGNVTQDPFSLPSPGSAQVYKAARELLNLGRQNRTHHEPPPIAPPDAPADQRYNTQDLLDAMATIEQSLGSKDLADVRLKPKLMEVLQQKHGGRKAFAEDQYDTLDVMENLVDTLHTDSLLTKGIRDWVKRLELTLNKLATKEPEFLRPDSENPHSAVEMLNQLARIGNARDIREGIDRQVGTRVDELLQRVVKEYDANPEVFEEVLGELNPLVERQNKAYRGNVERTVRASEGRQKLARARRHVINEMETRLADKDVPDLLLKLLNPGWRNLLVHTHLRYGPESNEWRDALATVDQLQAQLAGESQPGDADFLEPETLLKRVVEGLNSISYEPGKRTPLVMALSEAMVGDASGEKASVTTRHIDEEDTATALGLDGMLPEVEPRLETEDESLKQDWDRALERARRIHVGEWLAMTDEEGRPLILTVAFVGDDSSNFVLVNRKGVKVKDLDLKAMTDGLHKGDISLLEDFDLPLMERASQRMLQNMHNELTYQASHDELTDLLNRKEFERYLTEAIIDAQKNSKQHALLYVDMDQFKIINNTSGHTAGDELLKVLGEKLRDALKDQSAQVARLGGDEFGVLLEDVDTQQARDMAENVLAVIRNQTFDWEDRHYSLSASIGMVFVDETTENSDVVMRLADEACFTAKDAGRNRIQEYELGDTAMMHRHGVMEWVTQLDKALSDDRLVLNCQKIAPVEDTSDKNRTHYEILLTMQDELGDMMPPSEFILAAETYNRMTTIDRWVIERVLQWMAEHRDELDEFEGFAINVSGHSINDETFPDFVLEQFSKTQAPTSKVTFEITETAAIANLYNAVDFMNRMKIIGCRFSLDDFGTGLSSYSYLRNLPVDYVKIDGVFVKDALQNPSDLAVVRSINEIGHYMGKQIIAEFVESDEILSQIKEIGVDFAQGYGIEKPQPLDMLVI